MTVDIIFDKYQVLGKKGEGTFSEVLKCQNVEDGSFWACKKMKRRYETLDQVNKMQEVQALRRLGVHPNILQLKEVLYDNKVGLVVLVCELMDMNIYELIRGRRSYLPEKTVKMYMHQLLLSLDFMHSNGLFHRDVKPENILIRDSLLKLADFGSCRGTHTQLPYTEYISTRWYRAPECLLTDGFYSLKMDIWSFGCVFFEVMSLRPLFPGSNEMDQVSKIHDIVGTPDASILNKLKYKSRGMNFNFPRKTGTGIEMLLPLASEACLDIIYSACTYDFEERWTARDLLKHAYFREFRDSERKSTERKAADDVLSPRENDKQKRVKEKKEAVIDRHVDVGSDSTEQENTLSSKECIDLRGVVLDANTTKLEYRSSYRTKLPGYDQKLAAKKYAFSWNNSNSRQPKPLLSLTETLLHPLPLQSHAWESSTVQHKTHDRLYRGAFKKPQQSSMKHLSASNSLLQASGVAMVPQVKAAADGNTSARKQQPRERALAALNWMSYRSSQPLSSTFLPTISKSLTKVTDNTQYLEQPNAPPLELPALD